MDNLKTSTSKYLFLAIAIFLCPSLSRASICGSSGPTYIPNQYTSRPDAICSADSILSSSTIPSGSTYYFAAGPVVIEHADGSTTLFKSTCPTSLCNGAVLMKSSSTWKSGDAVYLAPELFDKSGLGQIFISSGIALIGSGIDRTIISDNSGVPCLGIDGSGILLKNLTVDATTQGPDGIAIGSRDNRAMDGLILEDIKTSGYDDDYYLFTHGPGPTINMIGGENTGAWDGIAFFSLEGKGVLNIYNHYSHTNNYGNPTLFGRAVSHLSGTINSYHSVYLSSSTSLQADLQASADILSGATFYSHGDVFLANDNILFNIQVEAGGKMYIDPATFFYSTHSEGTINYLSQYRPVQFNGVDVQGGNLTSLGTLNFSDGNSVTSASGIMTMTSAGDTDISASGNLFNFSANGAFGYGGGGLFGDGSAVIGNFTLTAAGDITINHWALISGHAFVDSNGNEKLDGTLTVSGNSALSTTRTTALDVALNGSLKTNGQQVGLIFSTYTTAGAYTLTTASATVAVGTSSMTITLTSSGTYIVNADSILFENGSTFVANDFVTMSVYRQNNTPGVVGNTTQWETSVAVSALTTTMGQAKIRSFPYTTTNTNDVLSLQISISASPAAGSVQSKESSLVAQRLY